MSLPGFYENRYPPACMHTWLTIDTAPKGGKWVLVWWPEITDCALVAYRGPGGWRCPVGSGYLEGDTYGHPTHWMPLPDPPETSS